MPHAVNEEEVSNAHSLESQSSLVLSVELIRPLILVVATSRSAVACVPVKSSGSPLPTVVRPLNVPLAMLASFAFVTTSLSIVHTVALDERVISPLSQSVRVGIDKSPLPRRDTVLIVLIFVPDTSIACLPAMSEASSLSVLRLSKF